MVNLNNRDENIIEDLERLTQFKLTISKTNLKKFISKTKKEITDSFELTLKTEGLSTTIFKLGSKIQVKDLNYETQLWNNFFDWAIKEKIEENKELFEKKIIDEEAQKRISKAYLYYLIIELFTKQSFNFRNQCILVLKKAGYNFMFSGPCSNKISNSKKAKSIRESRELIESIPKKYKLIELKKYEKALITIEPDDSSFINYSDILKKESKRKLMVLKKVVLKMIAAEKIKLELGEE